MAGKKKSKRKKTKAPRRPFRWVAKWFLRLSAVWLAVSLLWITAYAMINPPGSIYIAQEYARLGKIKRDWVDLEDIAPVMARSIVAAEDANFCNHWGFDMVAIRAAIADGGSRGASSLSQQTVKNAFLWQGRNWVRKALETMMTPMTELIWSKRRLLEVYMNLAEFDEGVFGVKAAAQHYFGTAPESISAVQAARLAAILPSPKSRSASKPAEFVRRRAANILDGAKTIRKDGRSACFED
ncbi:MAG: monofunctional biosynthetic peptidoglycan transglycosylase [Thalassovita sp.]